MYAAIIGALASVALLVGIMLLVPVLRRPRRPRLPDPPGDIWTSPYAAALADAQEADRNQGQQ